ncbi:hypothetical protein QL285_020194 [Trifolium repens]|nr:hypothetical protein QL285_020194 [Trifolium repens]
MASSSTFLNRTCMILPNESNPTEFAKDQRPYKYDEINVAIESPVDLESIRVNGFADVVNLYKKQGLEYYFDLLNGPTYTELVKEFWMKASVITRDVYDKKVREKMEKHPEWKERTPEEMGLRSFYSTEIESFVAGFRISIRLCHILEALKLKRDGVIIRQSDEVGPDVEEYLFKPKTDPKDKFEWTNNCKIIYRILIDSVLPKLGGTDQISSVQKLFTYNVAKGNIVDIGRLIFDNLCTSIISSKAIVRHSRLLSHMFAQCGLLDAVTPYLPGLGTFLLGSKIVNSTSLRYLRLVKNNEIIHPTHPLLLRNSEKGIGESWLVHVRDSEAKRVIEAHADFMKKLGADIGDGEPTRLTVRQSRLLERPLKLAPVKRKAAKSPAGKKAAKAPKTTAPRTSRKPKVKKLLLDLTEEEKEEAVMQAALAKVEEFNRKQEALKDGYECGIEESVFDKMHEKLPKRNDPHNLLAKQTLYGNETAQASTSTAPIIQTLDEDSDKTPSPPPDNSITKTLPISENVQPVNTQENTEPENDPQPEVAQPEHNPQPENEPEPENDQPENEPQPEHTTSGHNNQKSPEPEQEQVSDTFHSDEHVHEQSPHHVATDNSYDLPTPIKHHVQQINETLNLEILQRTPPNQSQHLQHLLQDLSMDCIFFPPHLPSRIANEPLDQTQDDITNLLKAVDKNLRRMSSAIPHRSIDTAHIDKECDLMEQNQVLMLRSVRKAYTTDLNLRNELARKEEEERRERERLEAEERERKRLEDERIERERQAAEQARLAEEARRAAEQARLEQLARNAPEYAQHVLENQENFQRKLDEHSSMLAAIMTTLQSINARLPQQPDQP